jgi:hypothetical protein
MVYVYRVRRLVKIVADEMANSTNPLEIQGNPTQHHCLLVFQGLNKKYTPQLARKTLAIATGKRHYLSTWEGDGRGPLTRQRLVVGDEGVILLTPEGFINALAGSISNIAVLISILALGVSIWAKLSK